MRCLLITVRKSGEGKILYLSCCEVIFSDMYPKLIISAIFLVYTNDVKVTKYGAFTHDLNAWNVISLNKKTLAKFWGIPEQLLIVN